MFNKISLNFSFFFFLCFLSIQLTFTLQCYECNNCTDNPSCTCTQTIEVDSNYFYCFILREKRSEYINFEIRHIANNRTSYYIYDPHYVSVEETIIYNNITEQWISISNQTAYACHTDNCNRADLLKELPVNGLSLMLPEDWLNKTLKRQTPGNTALCRECEIERLCGESPSIMNVSHLCQRKECHGSCLTDETYEQAETNQFCYSSRCSDDTTIGPTGMLPEIGIKAIYYIKNGKFDIVELDVVCNGDDCSQLELFQDIKDKLQKNLNNIKAFLPNHTKSIYSTSIIFLFMILFFQTFIFY